MPPIGFARVLSPSTQKLDRSDKMDVYAREAVRHAWLIDPIAKLLEVWRLEHEKWMRIGTWTDDAIVRAEPFDAVALELGTLWAD